jgi:hypothetical protein
LSQPYSNVNVSAPLGQGTKGNPFKAVKKKDISRNNYEPGTPWWWLQRLTQKLLDRRARYDLLEDYATGNHPLPNADYRYAKALRDLQQKARTNYCGLIISATTERMTVKGFRFGPAGEADEDAKRIWDYNDMDFQAPMNHQIGGTFGVCYGMVSPPDPTDPDSEPIITIEDPRMCIVERDPKRITRSYAGLKIWQDDTLEMIVACLYLPTEIHTFTSTKTPAQIFAQESHLSLYSDGGNFYIGDQFEYAFTQPNPLGEVPLVEGQWQPTLGELSKAEHEDVLDIQDRINHTVLDRLIISKSQAYRQRWGTGIKLDGKSKKAPFEPGADMLWLVQDQDAQFGDFETADIEQLLSAVTHDVGDMAATTKTPATYLMNRMVNVSGDALAQDQSGLVQKVKMREQAVGWFYERLMKLAFKYKNDERWKQIEASTLWTDPEIRTLAESGDAAGKFVSAGIPLPLVMERFNFTPDEIAFTVKWTEEQEAKQLAREDQQAQQAHDQAIEQQKVKAVAAGSGSSSTSSAKPKPKSTTATSTKPSGGR